MLTTIYRQEDGTVASLHLHAENDDDKVQLAQAAEHFNRESDDDEVSEGNANTPADPPAPVTLPTMEGSEPAAPPATPPAAPDSTNPPDDAIPTENDLVW